MPDALSDRAKILDLMASYRAPFVIGAAAELDLFTPLARQSLTAAELSCQLKTDERATTMLLDAVAALGLLAKSDGRYSVPTELRPLLASDSPQCILPMVWHSMTIARNWAQLARVTQTGRPAERVASVRGAEADRAAFVAAMHTISGPMADDLVARLRPAPFQMLLDVGGASGTWTMALLRAVPGSRAMLFDLPDAVEQARQRFAGTEFASRVTLVPGDFYTDELPSGADYVWLSAIIHQHSRSHNRELFGKIYRALVPGGRIGIRDLVMSPSRTEPIMGALFAINMLVNTDSGATFTLGEISEDLRSAGFVDPRLSVPADDMSAVVEANRPE